MHQYLKFEKNITFGCPFPNILLRDFYIYLHWEDTKFFCLWEVLTTAVNYIVFLTFNQELNSREVWKLSLKKANNLLFKNESFNLQNLTICIYCLVSPLICIVCFLLGPFLQKSSWEKKPFFRRFQIVSNVPHVPLSTVHVSLCPDPKQPDFRVMTFISQITL